MRERLPMDAEEQAEARVRSEPSAAPPISLLALQRTAGNQAVGRMLGRMSVRTAPTPAIVSGETRTKHVVAEADQEAEAKAGYGSRTFVTTEKALTDVIDADPFDFSEASSK